MPKIVGSAKLQMRKVASSAVGCVVVEAAKTVARQDRPCANGHAVPAARTGKDKKSVRADEAAEHRQGCLDVGGPGLKAGQVGQGGGRWSTDPGTLGGSAVLGPAELSTPRDGGRAVDHVGASVDTEA